MYSKVCFKCKKEKEISSFYAHPKMKDGHLNKCKDCAKTDVKVHRKENDSVRAYDRLRGNRQPEGYLKKYKEDNPLKYKAHTIVSNAKRSGKIVAASSCENCGAECKLHGHHDDYNKPLEVRWLCPKCHAGNTHAARPIGLAP